MNTVEENLAVATALIDGQYTGKNIQILSDREGVRTRPAMYIGSTSEVGLHHLVYELVDNSVDEALAGYCKNIDVIIHTDDSVTVSDDGRGIPIDVHPDDPDGRTAAELVFTKLHTGGKFSDTAYKVAGGLHGVGASVVNFLAESLRVEICREGFIYEQLFERGLSIAPLKQIGTTTARGTKVWFKPDSEIFPVTTFNFDTLFQRLREKSFLNKGLRITLRDERAFTNFIPKVALRNLCSILIRVKMYCIHNRFILKNFLPTAILLGLRSGYNTMILILKQYLVLLIISIL
jgi:DNA gyrase subunit B